VNRCGAVTRECPSGRLGEGKVRNNGDHGPGQGERGLLRKTWLVLLWSQRNGGGEIGGGLRTKDSHTPGTYPFSMLKNVGELSTRRRKKGEGGKKSKTTWSWNEADSLHREEAL